MMRITVKSFFGVLLPAFLIGLWLLAGREEVLVLAGRTMGTTYSVQLPELLRDFSRTELASLIQGELQRLDRGVFSTWAPDSELSRFNRAAPGTDFAASPELIDVILLAQDIHALSGGAFDMSVGPLVDLWGFGPAPPPAGLPAREAIEAARARLGSGAVEADAERGVLRKSRQVQLDLSGIAKGYAVDRIAGLLEARGIVDYLVEIGGEVRARGEKAQGEPWTLAIESPAPGPRHAQRLLVLPPAPVAVAGSGDYRNYFELDGVRYSHELDPRTGRPAAHALAAVTVIGTSAARADALATALMVLGPEEGRALAGGSGIPAYFIIRRDAGYEAVQSAAFTRFLQEAGTSASEQ